MRVTRPMLRYHGGKWRLAPWIVANMPRHRFYVEPFGGGASVLLRKPRSYGEVYNDADSDVVNVFRVMRDERLAAELARLLALTPYSREEFEKAYSSSAEAQTPGTELRAMLRARATIVRSFMGYGGAAIHGASAAGFGMRVTSSSWTVPTGLRVSRLRGTTPAIDWARYPGRICQFVERLRGVVLECRDAFEIIAQHDDEQALFYLDPPYLPSTRKSMDRHRYRHEMTEADHLRLAALVHGGFKGMVMISGYPSDLYSTEYKGWERIEFQHLAQRAVPTTEVLWMNPACTEARRQGKFQFQVED